ncbi:ATP-binding protein [Nostoc sp. KVJ3]|uniref:AVAST type 2 anti-phage system protein Avs2 n=1 Tax=Nostoc sp. KVJ3 TaxID=457945 RepID=UPI0022390D06|nr:AVAST type 2 anti-phage system protein Avs2 [Nostoc sp. KVJ3]MCW5318355.1 ATP-binding protein [Nostoc sp. KVJ3]
MSNDQSGENQQPNIQQEMLNNLNVDGDLTVENATQNIYFTPPPPELTINGMRLHFQEVQASAGARYTPKIHVDLPEAWVFEGLGRTDKFFDRIQNLYGQLSRKSKKLHPSGDTERKFPEIATLLNILGQKASTLAVELKQIDRDTFTPIDFPSLAILTQEVETAAYSSYEASRQAESSSEATETTQAPQNHGCTRSRKELLGGIRHNIFQLQQVLREILSLVTSDSAEAANKKAFLLLGEAGTGKTHLFCDVAKCRLDDSLPTIILLGQHFNSSESWTQIMQRLHLPFCDRNEFLGALDATAQARGRRALILIDALNEGDSKRLWRDELAGIVSVLNNYPRLGLAVSCRTSYERIVIPDGLIPEKLISVYHRGFDNHEYIATRTFFDHYGIERPNIPLLVPEFSNPLFLKIFCEGLAKRKLTRIPRGLKGITAILNFFVDTVHDILWKRLDYDDKTNLIRLAVEQLACHMAETGQPWIDRGEAKKIVNQILPTTGHQQTLFNNLLNEGLLSEDLVYIYSNEDDSEPQHIDTVKFPYEKFSDHLIVRYLLNKHLDKNNPVASFNPNQPLGKMLANDWETWRYSGWIEALSIQLPEQIGQELVELAPQGNVWDVVQRAFLQSIIWRNPTKVTNVTKDYLNEIFSQEGCEEAVYNLLLTVAADPAHPFNAKFLHNHLLSLEMPERDEWWSIYLSSQYEERGSVDRLLEWAWEAEKTHISDEAIELCAVALVWFLTTSHRYVRDRATKALVSMLYPRPQVLVQVIERFINVNDLYVWERLYAVAYGVAMLSDKASGVQELAGKVYEWVFKNGTPPAHILLRDYARGVIEVAKHRGILPQSVDIERCRPPYQTPWLVDIPTKEELEPYGETWEGMDDRDWSQWGLYNSVMGHGDFARYVIGTNHGDFEWSSCRLGEPGRKQILATRQQKYNEFIDSLTKKQKNSWERYEKTQSSVRLCKRLDTAKQIEYFQAEFSSDELNSILISEQNRFLRTIGKKKKENFNRFVLPHIQDSKGNEFRFDLSLVQSWILKIVFDFGWTVDRFGQFERTLDRYSYGERKTPERISKKYQWIAYHQFLAYVADNFEFIGSSSLNESPQQYDGPWQLDSGTRDIDPSLLVRQLSEQEVQEKTSVWWQPVPYIFDHADKQEQINWITQESDSPNPCQLIEVTRSSDETVWLSLEGHYRWTEEGPIEEEPYHSLRRDMWFQLRSYIVHQEDKSKILQWFSDKNFMGRWMPKSEQMLDVFVGEFPWASSCKALNNHQDWISHSKFEDDLPGASVVTTTEYLREISTFDCSIDGTISALMPSAWLIKNMGIRWSGGRFNFVDSVNELVAFNPLVEEAGSSACLISKEKLIRFLAENGLDIIWTVLGERQLIGGNHQEWHGRLELSGVYHLNEGIVTGERLKSWHQTLNND